MLKISKIFWVGISVIGMLLLFPQFVTAESQDTRAIKLIQNGSSSNGKRIALIIGNGNYQHSDSLPKLSNPPHDAEDIARALREFGFEVIVRTDQTLEGMNDAIAEFSRKIGDSDAAMFYFAGHGLQVKGQNYLIPINARIETEASVQYEGVNVNQILDEMENAKSHANIVMLDACRNNPITGKFRSGATRGLAAPTSSPKGTIIVYATDPGNVAADGNGRNGLFTAGLLTAFKGSDLSLGGVLERASEEVERGSAQKQTPYINGPATLQKRFQFAPSRNQQGVKLESVTANSSPITVSTNEGMGQPRRNQEVELQKGFISQGGLIWMPINDSLKTWSVANAYCKNTVINGQNGWRMPSKDELGALYESGAMKDHGWTLSNTWSSTPESDGRHYYFSLSNGVSIPYYNPYETNVTCVR